LRCGETVLLLFWLKGVCENVPQRFLKTWYCWAVLKCRLIITWEK
jgi:hypothetical protein